MRNKSWTSYWIVGLLLCLIALSTACEAPPPVVVTDTPLSQPSPTEGLITVTPLPTVPDPTPTEEDLPGTPVPGWDQSCMRVIADTYHGGIFLWPMNQNACLKGDCISLYADPAACFPEQFTVEVTPDCEDQGLCAYPAMTQTGDGVAVDLSYFDGDVDIIIPGLELTGQFCYSVNVLIDIHFVGSSAQDIDANYSLKAVIYDDHGNVFTTNKVGLIDWAGSTAIMDGEKMRWFNFTPISDRTVELHLIFHVEHGVAVNSNYVEFLAIYVTRNPDPGNCAGMGF